MRANAVRGFSMLGFLPVAMGGLHTHSQRLQWRGGEADRHIENWMFLEANLNISSLRGRAQYTPSFSFGPF